MKIPTVYQLQLSPWLEKYLKDDANCRANAETTFEKLFFTKEWLLFSMEKFQKLLENV